MDFEEFSGILRDFRGFQEFRGILMDSKRFKRIKRELNGS